AGGAAPASRSARLAAGKRWVAAAVPVLAAGSTGNGWRELPGADPGRGGRLAVLRAGGAPNMVEEIDRPVQWVHEDLAPDFQLAMMYNEGFDDRGAARQAGRVVADARL